MIDQIITSLNGLSFLKDHFAQIIGFFTFASSILLYFFVEELNQILDKAYNKKDLAFTRSGFFQIQNYSAFKIKRFVVTFLLCCIGLLIFCTQSAFHFIKYFNIVIIFTTLAFLNHKRAGKRSVIFKLFTAQSLFFAMLILVYLSIVSANIISYDVDSFKTISNAFHKTTKHSLYKIVLSFVPMFVVLAMCGFSPFDGLINNVFKKLSPSEKIIYIGIVINICQYTVIQFYSRESILLYIAIFYLIVNALQLVTAQKINDILLSLIRFSFAVFLILLSIKNLSTNYASLFIYSVFAFTFACIICYEWMYYDIGFFSKPKTIIAKIKKFNIYNKYSLKSFILIAIALQVFASPISASFLPFLFLQLTFNNILLSHYLMFFILFVISLAVIKLIYPFYICLKYSTSFFSFHFDAEKRKIQGYFDKTNIALIIIFCTLIVFALYFNLSYLMVYQNLYVLDSLIYCGFAVFLAYLFYKTKFYIISLILIHKIHNFILQISHSLVKYAVIQIKSTNNTCLNVVNAIKTKSIDFNKFGGRAYKTFINHYKM